MSNGIYLIMFWCTIHQTLPKDSRLNNFIVLHAKKDATNSLDLTVLDKKFIGKYQTRIYIFVCY